MSVILKHRHLSAMKIGFSLTEKCLQASLGRSSQLFSGTDIYPANAQYLQARTFKSRLKIKWVRPPKIPCIDPAKSGDLQPVTQVDMERLPPEFDNAEGSKDMDSLVRRILSLNFRPANIAAKVVRDETVDSVKMHILDSCSEEAIIAELTARIRSLQKHMEKYPKDKKNKVMLKEMIERRKKRLKFLRAKDYKRFEWLLEKLQLEYRPPPNIFRPVTRKDSLRRLTARHCRLVRRQHLSELRSIYEEQKPIFLREKADKFRWIRQQELECGIEPTVSEEDIEKVEQQLNELEAANAREQEKRAKVN